MTDKGTPQGLLSVFDHMRVRPGLYGILEGQEASLAYLHALKVGFLLGQQFHDVEFETSQQDRIYWQVIEEHGWEVQNTLSVDYQMKQQGYTAEAIIEEVLSIYCEVLIRRYHITDEQVAAAKWPASAQRPLSEDTTL